MLACFRGVFFWYCLLFRVTIHFLTSPPMLACGFQVTVDQRIFYSTLVHLCLVYVAGIGSRNFQLLPWLVILYYLNYLLSSFIHVTIRTSFILVSMSLWCSSAILVRFFFWHKSYPKQLWLPSGWIARVIYHFFDCWRYKTWSLTL